MKDELRIATDAVYDAMRGLRLAIEQAQKAASLETADLSRREIHECLTELQITVGELGVLIVGKQIEKLGDTPVSEIARRLGVTRQAIYTLEKKYEEITERK